MTIPLHVCFLPSDFAPEQVRGATAVIVDVLRASTTITWALAEGARCVVPCETIEQAKELRQQHPAGQCLLGGERKGVRIDGFEFSNSPSDYNAATVGDRVVGFTTTNGTRALLRARQAECVMVAAFVNLNAACRLIVKQGHPVFVVCAGTDGSVSSEDVLLAGALVDQLLTADRHPWQPSDAARIARHHWQQMCARASADQILTALLQSHGGRNLTELGFGQDIATAARIDALSVVGILHAGGELRAAEA